MTETNDIRLAYAVWHDNRETREDRRNTALWETIRDAAYAEFDAWLVEHDRQELRGAADELSGAYPIGSLPDGDAEKGLSMALDWLRRG